MKRKKHAGATGHTLPEKFSERLVQMFPDLSLYREVEKTFAERPTTFRVNGIKMLERPEKSDLRSPRLRRTRSLEIVSSLREKGFRLRPVPWHEDAFILENKSKRELTEMDMYMRGFIYIQSLASMVPPLVLDPKPGEKVLDLTAAPGSKTSQIASLMEQQGELVANDNNKVRFFKLKHNMELLGVLDDAPNWTFSLRMEHGVKICKEYPEYFDTILLDAPCSAEARFVMGEPKTFGYWSERKIKEMAYKQRQLLLSAWTALKPGGILVYSTCTFAPEENEVQIDRLLQRFPDEVELMPIDLPLKRLPIMKEWKGKKLDKELQDCLRIMPTAEIEGFFVAKIHKKAA